VTRPSAVTVSFKGELINRPKLEAKLEAKLKAELEAESLKRID